MDYAELLQQVQVAGALDQATAEGVMLATVVTLAERMRHQELGRLGPGCRRSCRGGAGWLAVRPAVWRR